jgi:acyl carrier protein
VTIERVELPLDFEVFADTVIRKLEINISSVSVSTSLIDCDLDSIGMYELLIVVEEMGVQLPDDEISTWTNFGDVYHTYVTQFAV